MHEVPVDADQRRAAGLLAEHGKIMVEAAPGTGKTFLAVYLGLVGCREGWVSRDRPALLLTFSRSARVQLERELQRFIAEGWLTRENARALQVTNYHAFFLEHLSGRSGLWGCNTRFRPATLAHVDEVIRAALGKGNDEQLKPREQSRLGLCLAAKRWQMGDLCAEDPEEADKQENAGQLCFSGLSTSPEEQLLVSAEADVSCGRPWYTHLAPLFYNLLEHSAAFTEWLRLRYPLVIVDEFQDTELVEYEVIRKMQPKRLVLLCDRYQMIYGWRGARADRMEEAQQDLGIGRDAVVELRKIHRTKAGHGLATFIQQLRADALQGNRLDDAARDWLCCHEYTPAAGWGVEAGRTNMAIAGIAGYIRTNASHDGSACVLVRDGETGVQFSCKLRSIGRDCRLLTGSRAAPDERLRDVLGELSTLDGEASCMEWLGKVVACMVEGAGVPDLEREFGGNKMPFENRRRVELVAAKQHWNEVGPKCARGGASCLAAGLRASLATVDDLRRRGDVAVDWEAVYYVRMLERSAAGFATSIPWQEACRWLETSHLRSVYLRLRQPVIGLWVMTVHQAKGREFDEVVIPWVSAKRWQQDPFGCTAEDRRLLYVALTRAKKRVTIIYPSCVDEPWIIQAWHMRPRNASR